MLQGDFEEMLYPVAPNARFTRAPPRYVRRPPPSNPRTRSPLPRTHPPRPAMAPRPPTGQYCLQTAHFAAFWNIMIHYALRLFRRILPQSLLNVKFEEVQSDPEPQIKRIIRFISPALEDSAWREDACAVPRPTASRFQ